MLYLMRPNNPIRLKRTDAFRRRFEFVDQQALALTCVNSIVAAGNTVHLIFGTRTLSGVMREFH